jgi:hypothetical protein
MMGQRNACRLPVHVIATLVVFARFSGGSGAVAAAGAFSGPLPAVPAAQAAVATQVSMDDICGAGQTALKQTDVSRQLASPAAPETAARWTDSSSLFIGRRWPFRADPRRWPRLFANTTECTLSFNPVTRRHWWQR